MSLIEVIEKYGTILMGIIFMILVSYIVFYGITMDCLCDDPPFYGRCLPNTDKSSARCAAALKNMKDVNDKFNQSSATIGQIVDKINLSDAFKQIDYKFNFKQIPIDGKTGLIPLIPEYENPFKNVPSMDCSEFDKINKFATDALKLNIDTLTNGTKEVFNEMGDRIKKFGTIVPIIPNCPAGQTLYEGLCYNLPAGAVIVSPGIAKIQCPEGWRDDGAYCRHDDSYDRGVGITPNLEGCPANTHDVGGSCWKDNMCPGGPAVITNCG